MADIVLQQGDQLPLTTSIRYRDMGDGTYAMVRSSLISGTDEEGNIVVPQLSCLTRALVGLTYYEEDVFGGDRYKITYLQAHGDELNNDAIHDFLIKVGARTAYHTILRAATGGNSDFLLYENTIVSANGVKLSTSTRNRQNIKVPTLEAYDTPTVTEVGTLLTSWFLPGGSRGAPVGGGYKGTQWILASDTNYLIRLTNRSGLSIMFSVSIGWSEY